MARPFHVFDEGVKRVRFTAFFRGACLIEGAGDESTLRSPSSCLIVDDGINSVETGTDVGTPLSVRAGSRWVLE